MLNACVFFFFLPVFSLQKSCRLQDGQALQVRNLFALTNCHWTVWVKSSHYSCLWFLHATIVIINIHHRWASLISDVKEMLMQLYGQFTLLFCLCMPLACQVRGNNETKCSSETFKRVWKAWPYTRWKRLYQTFHKSMQGARGIDPQQLCFLSLFGGFFQHCNPLQLCLHSAVETCHQGLCRLNPRCLILQLQIHFLSNKIINSYSFRHRTPFKSNSTTAER